MPPQTDAASLAGQQSNNNGNLPECFGRKICPSERWRMRCCFPCLEEFVLRKLLAGWSPTDIRKEVKDVQPCLPDHMILCMIGNVAVSNGYHFGRKKVDRAIKESNIDQKFNPRYEKQLVRESFGVYGREGAHRAKEMPIGRTETERINAETRSDQEA